MSKVYHPAQQDIVQLPLFVLSRVCTKCHTDKPLEEFHQSKSGKHGRTEKCKECSRQQYKETYVPKPRRKREVVPITAKICRKCHIEKSIDNFSKDPRGKNGYKPRCNQCEAIRYAGYREQT